MAKILCIFVILSVLFALALCGGSGARSCPNPGDGCSGGVASASTTSAVTLEDDSQLQQLLNSESNGLDEYEEVGTLEEQTDCFGASCYMNTASYTYNDGKVMNLEGVPNLGLFMKNGICVSSCEWFYTKLNISASACRNCQARFLNFMNTTSCAQIDYTKKDYPSSVFRALYDMCASPFQGGCDCNGTKLYIPPIANMTTNYLGIIQGSLTASPPQNMSCQFFKDILRWGANQTPKKKFNDAASPFKFVFTGYNPSDSAEVARIVGKYCVRMIGRVLLAAPLLSTQTSLPVGATCTWRIALSALKSLKSQRDFMYN